MSNFVIENVEFTFKFQPDHDMPVPWKDGECHGLVRIIDSKDFYKPKAPGEVRLHTEGRTSWVYDVSATIKLAAKARWGLSDFDIQQLEQKLGRNPTSKEITARAVNKDLEFCRSFLKGDVSWFSVRCWPTDDEGAGNHTYGLLCGHGDPLLNDAAYDLALDYLASLKSKAGKELNTSWLATHSQLK